MFSENCEVIFWKHNLMKKAVQSQPTKMACFAIPYSRPWGIFANYVMVLGKVGTFKIAILALPLL